MLTEQQRQLAADHRTLAYRCACFAARKHAGAYLNDLLSDANLGLVDAAGKYDPACDASFKSFAHTRIQGEIKDGLRDRDVLTRSDRRYANQIEKIRHEFARRERRFPTDLEVARELGMAPRTLGRVLARLSRAGFVPLDRPVVDDEDSTLQDLIRDPSAEQKFEAVLSSASPLGPMLRRLPDRERFVVSLYYWEDCTLREIGDVLGVTESRVSQLLTKALKRLRRMPAVRELAEVA